MCWGGNFCLEYKKIELTIANIKTSEHSELL